MNEDINKPILIKELGFKEYGKIKKVRYKFGIFQCKCGNLFESTLSSVRNNQTKTCGCLRKENSGKRTHGFSRTRIYNIWKTMIQRCTNKRNIHYKNYGARGISVCERWLSFPNFEEDMNKEADNNLSIDRINVNGNYEPSNCRWATSSTQSKNTRVLRSTNTSGYRGVEWISVNKKWRARIGINKKNIHIGCFSTALEAAKAYDSYVIENNLEHTINGVL